MKKYLITMLALMLGASSILAQEEVKAPYLFSDLEGIWVATASYDPVTNKRKAFEGTLAIGFTNLAAGSKRFCILRVGEEATRCVYAITGSTITLYHAVQRDVPIVEFNIVRMYKGFEMYGLMKICDTAEDGLNVMFSYTE